MLNSKDFEQNYYKLLQVDPQADRKVIHKAYLTIMSELNMHPDKGGNVETAKILNRAWEILKDSYLREEYNRQLFSKDSKNETQTKTDYIPQLFTKEVLNILNNPQTVGHLVYDPKIENNVCVCRRCGYQWEIREGTMLPTKCRNCKSRKWNAILLFKCRFCNNIFESYRIEYDNPYNLHEKCPKCNKYDWNEAYERLQERMKDRDKNENTSYDDIGNTFEDTDELFKNTLLLIKDRKKVSAQLLQGAFHISGRRASNLISLMEIKRLIGPDQGLNSRKIYFDRIEKYIEIFDINKPFSSKNIEKEIQIEISLEEGEELKNQGVTIYNNKIVTNGRYVCHRCKYEWYLSTPIEVEECPKCRSKEWDTLFLFQCLHCKYIFCSDTLKLDECGGYDLSIDPYEEYPVCPSCGKDRWCMGNENFVREEKEYE